MKLPVLIILTFMCSLPMMAQNTLSLELKELKVGNMLTWQIANAPADAKFFVFRTTDHQEFTMIGELPGNGASGEQSYRFLDVASGLKNAGYQVRMKSANQELESSLVELERAVTNNLMVSSMGNTDTKGIFHIELFSEVSGQGKYSVVSAQEGSILEEPRIFRKGLNTFDIDFADFSPGRYKLVFQLGNEVDEITIRRIGGDAAESRPSSILTQSDGSEK